MARVLIGMSGGVDSTVAACLLQKEGYEVVGITFKFIADFDATDAIKMCAKLGIEHHVVDYQNEFKKLIIDNFLFDYKKGLTPNPCVICNRDVKLKFLYDEMQKLNCDYIATGHYARYENGKLYRSNDINKDQTYFLCEVPKKILDKILFPLENIDKEKVRKIAYENDLDVASKKDSTDVCFINDNFRKFMQENVNNTEGNVIDVATKDIIGKHKGLSFYTIGQRKGLNIGGYEDKLFVVGKSTKDNILYVCRGNENDYLLSDSCLIKNVNLISYHHPTFCTAKFRYRSKEVAVELEYLKDNKILVKYPEKVSSVTPGQVCALYLGSECIGGGIIEKVYKDNEELWYVN